MWLTWLVVCVTGFACFIVGRRISAMVPRRMVPAICVGAGLLALPGFLFAAYYLHVFDGWIGFVEFRALPGTEFLGATSGLAAGMTDTWVRRHYRASAWGVPALFFLAVSVPFLKTTLTPLDKSALSERWENEVCLQSSASTCGPASAATILRHMGLPITELQLASEARTAASGTEIWYLIRAIRRRGLVAEPRGASERFDGIAIPVIAGVRNPATGAGHFIAIVESAGDRWFVADPLSGGQWYSVEQARMAFTFTGFYVEISRSRE